MIPRFARCAGAACALAAVLASASADDPKPRAPAIERTLSGPATALVASPDGKWLAAADEVAGEVVLFSTTDAVRRVAAHSADTDRVLWVALAFTDDSRFLVVTPSESHDGEIVVHVVAADSAKQTAAIDCSTRGSPTAGAGAFFEAVPGPDGSKVTVRRLNVVEVWDAATGERLSTDRSPGPAIHVLGSPDRKVEFEERSHELALVDAGRRFERWRIDAAEDVSAPKGGKPGEAMHDRSAHTVGFTLDGKLVLVAWTWKPGPKNASSQDVHQLVAYGVADGKPTWKHDMTARGRRDVAAGAGVVAVVVETGVEFIDVATGKSRSVVATAECPAAITASKDGRSFWVGLLRGSIVELTPPAK